ncbi:MAG: DNA-binding response regulator [Cycloclasticus sp.]|nr:DNA-binding response regulator [Cycloclasticus sp.]
MIDVLIIDKTDQIKSALLVPEANIASFDDEVKALNAVETKVSAVVLLNYSVMQEQTAEYIKVVLKVSSSSKIVVIADELSEEETLNCLLAGAKGYQQLDLLKDYARKLVTVMDAGEAWITRRMTATLLDALRRQ